jgi:hypothetical protein
MWPRSWASADSAWTSYRRWMCSRRRAWSPGTACGIAARSRRGRTGTGGIRGRGGFGPRPESSTRRPFEASLSLTTIAPHRWPQLASPADEHQGHRGQYREGDTSKRGSGGGSRPPPRHTLTPAPPQWWWSSSRIHGPSRSWSRLAQAGTRGWLSGSSHVLKGASVSYAVTLSLSDHGWAKHE